MSDERDRNKHRAKDGFTKATEPLSQQITRLEREASAIDRRLQEPSKPSRSYLTRSGNMRVDGDEHIRDVAAKKRVDLNAEIKRMKAEQKAHEKSLVRDSKERGR